MSLSVQPAGLAGMFYPSDPGELAARVDGSLARAAPPSLAPKAVIAPHAGHIYSGDIAAAAFPPKAERALGTHKPDFLGRVESGHVHRRPARTTAAAFPDYFQFLPPLPIREDVGHVRSEVEPGVRKFGKGEQYDLSKPQGVRGRNSDNTRLRQVLTWEPAISLEEGLDRTYHWIRRELVRMGRLAG